MSDDPQAGPGLRERNRRRTHAEIAAAALVLFETRGFETTTVEEIATAAGVSPATFFRYFAAKEDVLFADEDMAASAMVTAVARRPDPSSTLAALAEPVTEFARSLVEDSSSDTRLMTRLVMTTRSLESRSLRMRLRWEREVSAQLAREGGRPGPSLADTLIAAIAVSCLTTALRHWEGSPGGLAPLVTEAFARATARDGDRYG